MAPGQPNESCLPSAYAQKVFQLTRLLPAYVANSIHVPQFYPAGPTSSSLARRLHKSLFSGYWTFYKYKNSMDKKCIIEGVITNLLCSRLCSVNSFTDVDVKIAANGENAFWGHRGIFFAAVPWVATRLEALSDTVQGQVHNRGRLLCSMSRFSSRRSVQLEVPFISFVILSIAFPVQCRLAANHVMHSSQLLILKVSF